MFRSKYNPNLKNVKIETSKEFLNRGGKITKIIKGDSYKRKTRKSGKINAQKLLDNCRCEAEQENVINFLKLQGIKVED